MHHWNSEFQIGEESTSISSDSDFTPSLSFSPNIQIPTQLHPPISTSFATNQPDPQTRLSIQIQNLSSPPHPSPNAPPTTQQNYTVSLCNHERFSNNPPASQSPLSSPHKRPMMTKSSSAISSTLSSPRCNQEAGFHTDSLSPSYRCCGSFTTPFGTQSLSSLKLFSHLRCARLLRPHFRFLIVLSLPSLYFLVSNPRRSFLIDLLCLIAFSAALLISLKLALPRLPSIRLFLARSLPIKLNSPSTNHPQPVLWSIGSKPKSEKSATSGFSVQVYSNGDVYEGEFHKGKCSGSGVYHYHLSGRYEGDWVDGKYDGYGVETWAKGSRYRGQYRQGLRHGIGIYRFFAGDVYAGEWSNGQCHGCGVHTCQDGSRYIGEFKWGVKHGLGHYHFRNGDMYAGEYFADKMHGFGVYKFQIGHRYEGAWHEGRRQGLGMYFFRNGETQSGHWQNGILDDPKTHTSPSGSPSAVHHAKVFNAVQDARCAAEKAFDIAKVDERVNKGIAAANRAANAARVAAVKAVQNRMQQNNNDEQ